MQKQSTEVRYYAHRTESRYLRVDAASSMLLICTHTSSTFSTKTILNPEISKLEKELLYQEIPYCEYSDALRQVHNQLFAIEFGHGLEKCAK